MRRMSSQFAGFSVVLLVAGCGGGGGSSSVPEVPFTSFLAVRPSTTVAMSGGISTTATGTYTTAGTTTTVSPLALPIVDTSAANAQKLTYDSNRALSGMTFSTPNGSASFSRSSGPFVCSVGVCQGISGTATGVVIDGVSSPLGWSYQTFGVWERPLSATTLQAGAISAGAVTPASAVPSSGSATFTGLTSAFYVDAGGTPYFAAAQMSATATWTGTPSIAFSTSGTQTVNLNSGLTNTNASFLNLTGTFSYDSNVNRFSGPVNAPGATMSGTGTGRFYGPAAQEIGGAFNLTGLGGSMIGGFGGRQ